VATRKPRPPAPLLAISARPASSTRERHRRGSPPDQQRVPPRRRSRSAATAAIASEIPIVRVSTVHRPAGRRAGASRCSPGASAARDRRGRATPLPRTARTTSSLIVSA
jgi:hypothetical protein